jgi:pSer/pThr/pTyr-binding forkhead associated (FHA) protein
MLRHRLRFSRRDIHLPLGVTLIGRGADCDVAFDDPQVSRRHARLVVGADRAVVEDLASLNGIDVNGTRVNGLTLLRNADRVRIGQAEFVFCKELAPADGDEPASHGPPVTRRGLGCVAIDDVLGAPP